MSSSILASRINLVKRFYKLRFLESQLINNMSTSASPPEELVVHHDPQTKKFFIKLGESEAKLEYAKETNSDKTQTILDLWHTEVPPALQGKGIAKVLAKEAFEHVVQNNFKMRLSCTYLQKYFNDNPLEKYKNAVE